VSLRSGRKLAANAYLAERAGVSCAESSCVVTLDAYDFVVLRPVIPLEGQALEVEPDALELIEEVFVVLKKTSSDAKICIGCTIVEETIWELYEQMPGGMWVFCPDKSRSGL